MLTVLFWIWSIKKMLRGEIKVKTLLLCLLGEAIFELLIGASIAFNGVEGTVGMFIPFLTLWLLYVIIFLIINAFAKVW